MLSNDAHIELLEAVNLTATDAFDLTGSDSANIVSGNDGVNVLRGQGGNDSLQGAGGDDFLVGGTGTDTMAGGTGNDTYYVDDASDIVFEIAGEGNERPGRHLGQLRALRQCRHRAAGSGDAERDQRDGPDRLEHRQHHPRQ